jgi:hypothetical protein
VHELSRDFYGNEAAAREAVESGGRFNLIHLDSAIKLDLFVRGKSAYDLEEFRRHRPEVILQDPERRVFVKSAEDILLRKLQWFRIGGAVSDRQRSDVLGIVRTQGERLDRVNLERWAPALGGADLLPRALATG